MPAACGGLSWAVHISIWLMHSEWVIDVRNVPKRGRAVSRLSRGDNLKSAYIDFGFANVTLCASKAVHVDVVGAERSRHSRRTDTRRTETET